MGLEEQLEALNQLDDRAAYAVACRFGLPWGETTPEPHTFKMVGEKLDITAEAARRLVKRCVNEFPELVSSSQQGSDTVQ